MQLFGILQERPLNWIIACYVQSLKRGPNLVIKYNVMHRELELHITQIVALFRFEGNIPVRDFLTASAEGRRSKDLTVWASCSADNIFLRVEVR